jgi:hypothetical protein
MLKEFKTITLAPACFGSCRNHHKGAVLCLAKTAKYGFSVKAKVILQQAEVAQGVLGRLRPRIFLMFSTTRVVGHQPYTLAAFTLGEIPGTHFQRLN